MVFLWKWGINMNLKDYIQLVQPIDQQYTQQMKQLLDQKAHPIGSLGKLEDLALQLASIQKTLDIKIKKKCIAIFCADNGIFEEGVASTPQNVTLMQSINFSRGYTGVCVLAKQGQVDLKVVDVGINSDVVHPKIVNRKIRKSTYNFAKRTAMSEEEAIQSIIIGIETILEPSMSVYDVFGVGEMGIGNTSTSSAVLSALCSLPPVLTVGRGAGLSDEKFAYKINMIENALKLHHPNSLNPIEVLASVGGFDLGAMAGAFIGAAIVKKPIVIDGFISAVAALLATRLCPEVKPYLIPSHCSYEKGYHHAMQELNLSPFLMLDMRLGEGSGCPLAFSILEYACSLTKMGSFEEAQINDEYLKEFRKDVKHGV